MYIKKMQLPKTPSDVIKFMDFVYNRAPDEHNRIRTVARYFSEVWTHAVEKNALRKATVLVMGISTWQEEYHPSADYEDFKLGSIQLFQHIIEGYAMRIFNEETDTSDTFQALARSILMNKIQNNLINGLSADEEESDIAENEVQVVMAELQTQTKGGVHPNTSPLAHYCDAVQSLIIDYTSKLCEIDDAWGVYTAYLDDDKGLTYIHAFNSKSKLSGLEALIPTSCVQEQGHFVSDHQASFKARFEELIERLKD